MRVEKPERAVLLYQSWEDHYRALTLLVMDELPFKVNREQDAPQPIFHIQISPQTRRLNRLGWMLRRLQGKFLSLFRLMKAAFTFQGGVDYLVWKLERHTGVPIEVTPKVRRHPLIYGWGMMWRLYRRGVFR